MLRNAPPYANLMRALCFIGVPFVWSLPSLMVLYFLASGMTTCLQSVFLGIPSVRRRFELPPAGPVSVNESTSLFSLFGKSPTKRILPHQNNIRDRIAASIQAGRTDALENYIQQTKLVNQKKLQAITLGAKNKEVFQ